MVHPPIPGMIVRPLKEEELPFANSHDMPPRIEGMDIKMLPIFIECMPFSDKHGYDPKTDYRKKLSLLHVHRSPIFEQIEGKQ